MLVLVVVGAPTLVSASSFTFTQVCPQRNPTDGIVCSISENEDTNSTTVVDTAVGGGWFTGTASSRVDGGSFGIETSVSLTNYSPLNNIWPPNTDSLPNVARAEAHMLDTVTVSGVLPETYLLTYTFELDGSFSSTTPWITSNFVDATALCPVEPAICFDGSVPLYWDQGGVLPETYTRTFTLNTNVFREFFSFLVTTNVPTLTAEQAPIYAGVLLNGSGSAEFGNTITLLSMLFTDLDGTPLTGLALDSTSGFEHPLDALNTVPTAVPEPASLLLLGSGLAASAWKARRRTRSQR